MDIPVFHDDQHGTAIVAAAGLINACHLTGRELRDTKLVVNGAGAAAIACVELLKAMGLRPDHVILCDTKGVVYQGRTGRHEPVEIRPRRQHQGAHPGRGAGRGRRGVRPVGQGRADPGHGRAHGRPADHLRHGQPRPRDHARGSARGQPEGDHRHRAQRLSEPGEQRPGLPLHLPRRARCARQHHQRRDEDRRGRGPGAAGARRRAGRGAQRLRRPAAELRARIHHSERVRSAADLLGGARGRQGGDRQRRGAQADRRPAPLRARTVRPARSDRRGARRGCWKACATIPSGWCSPRARRKRWCAPRSRSATPATAPRC